MRDGDPVVIVWIAVRPLTQPYALGVRVTAAPWGEVYRAVRTGDGRSILLKVLKSEHSGARELERLRNEYEMGRALAGAAVAVPLSITTFEGRPALEFEAFPGVSLEDLARSPMPVESLLRVATSLVRAVVDIHKRGVIHKDLKPANILFDAQSGRVQIWGLGIAGRLGSEQTTVGPVQTIEGSLPYMSPEQTGRTNRAIDSRSDLYSLGVTFHQLLTGTLPFEANDALGWVHSHVARLPPRVDAIRPSLPGVLSEIVFKLLAKAPEHRYQSASGLLRDLDRCEHDLRDCGVIAPFTLAEHDIPDRLIIPQKLYGREGEVEALRAALDRVAGGGASELVLLFGHSGIGKSSVVNDLLQPILKRRGLFLSGKCEYKREIPYRPILHALRELALDILAESAERIAAWRERLAKALGSSAGVITKLNPELELILGPQPSAPEPAPAEAEIRLRVAFHELFDALTAEHSVTMFLDDLQWADVASLKLLEELMSGRCGHHLLVIGAFRIEEVDASHPLVPVLSRIRASGAIVRDLSLGPISQSNVASLLADTLHCTPLDAAPLARLIGEKTGGNPFFVIQLLTRLCRDGSIHFDSEAGRWRWNIAEIRAARYTDNVVGLLVDKLHGLPAEAQEALTTAACMGATVERDALEIVLRTDPDVTLRSALDEGLLLHLDHEYRFPHDRVQEAASSLVPQSERAVLHLEIGRRLLAGTSPARLEERIFDVVNQLDRDVRLITSHKERECVAELNLQAGMRAKASTAFAAAATYFAAGMALLGEESWTDRYPLAFKLCLERADCELLSGRFDTAQRLIADLMPRCATTTDIGEVYRVKIDLHLFKVELAEAVESALACLRLFGIDIAAHPSWEEVQAEYEGVRRALGDRSIESLVEVPLSDDPELCTVMGILVALFAPAFFSDLNLVCVVLCRSVTLSMTRGTTAASAHGYGYFGQIVAFMVRQFGWGARFGRLAGELVEKHRFTAFRAKVSLAMHACALWTEPLDRALDLIRKTFDAALESGDLSFACYSWPLRLSLLLVRGDPLESLWGEWEAGVAFVRKARFHEMENILLSQGRFIQGMQGPGTSDRANSCPPIDEAAFERQLAGRPSLAAYYWVLKLKSRFLNGDYQGALAARQEAQRVLWAITAHIAILDYAYFSALTLTALYDDAPASARPALRQSIAAEHERLREWADSAPQTFRDKLVLVSAEIARIDGKDFEAARLYEQGIRAAREGGFVHDEAIAYETAARFFRGHGFEQIADTYLGKAHECYRRWGAHGKVGALERLYPQVRDQQRPFQVGAILAVPTEQLDLLSVFKASQTISGVMATEDLLRTLLRVVLEEGNARRACVVLPEKGKLEIRAESAVGETGQATVLRAEDRELAARVPVSVVQYVQRTGERVLLEDAVADGGRFSGDAYFAHASARSVLALPIRRQAQLVAVLYLENDLVSGAFTRERLLALELLATQTAISLENALLLEAEHRARVEAEAAAQRAQLLGEATALMSSKVDSEGAFLEVARLCSRWFADWTMIDIEVDGEVERLASAHRDAEKDGLLRELAQKYPARAGTPTIVRRVLETGLTVSVSGVTDEQIRAQCVDDRHAELHRLVGTRSGVSVPLVARDHLLGALTFASSLPYRFGPADIELAEELGRRTALALDNVRLLEQTGRALRLREEFLALASHELRTPLTSLRLSVQQLQRVATGRAVSPEALASNLDRILRRTDRLEQLAGELLDVMRIYKGGLELQYAETDLEALVRGVVTRFEREMAAARCAVSIECARPVVGKWDRARIRQVVSQLLGNAIKFSAGRPVEIHIDERDGLAQLRVIDHGIGIERARLRHLFERFERGVSSTHYGGLGLGLYLARWIVRAHGGTIAVESEPGVGSTFTVVLPSTPEATTSRSRALTAVSAECSSML